MVVAEAYAIVCDGRTLNTVLWDGVTLFDPGEDCELVLVGEAPPMFSPVVPSGVLQVERWTIPADGVQYAVVSYGTSEAVYFVVNGVPTLVEPEYQVAKLGVDSITPGPIRIEIRDQSVVIVAEEVS